jgi:phosphopentomutase
VSGHWELAGAVTEKPFADFDEVPDELVGAIEEAAGVEFLGNPAANGANVLDEYGAAHLASGRPILFAGGGSTMHIAAHEEAIPRARLFAICRVARKFANTQRVARVTAVPFTGKKGKFIPAASHDYPMVPPRTILNAISETGLHVDAIGETATIFARNGISRHHAAGTMSEALATIDAIWRTHHEGLIVASLPGFHTHGARLEPEAFGRTLMQFDAWLAGFVPLIGPEDLLIVTAAHGSDPALPGTGPTREDAPLIMKFDDKKPEPLGTRNTLADVAATLALFFHLKPWPVGTPFIKMPRTSRPSRRR